MTACPAPWSRLLDRRCSLVLASLLLAAHTAFAQAAPAPTRPKVGLVLAGGGARGGAHLGVLKVLEELRVPVDVIVGTSAGSIVGAAYATGMPLRDIEREMRELNTELLFHDRIRDDVPLRDKADDAVNHIGPEVGLGPGGLALPKGAVSGVALEGVLRRLTVHQREADFDRLPIPFRAVATDVATAEMVVLQRGVLSEAIRASMAIPAAVNPVEIDGRLLVDGGVSRNLPVDVARALGAQVIIAVDISTPLLARKDITSLLSVSSQMLRILTAKNVQQSRAELRTTDVLITPDLSAVSSADFDDLPVAAAAGEAAARSAAAQLAALAVPEAEHARWLARRQPSAEAVQGTLAAVRVEGTARVNPEVVVAAMQTRAGDPIDAERIERDMKRIYGRGDFERVEYAIAQQPGVGPVLTAHVAEKSWGPNYLRVGLGLSSDFEGNSYFSLLATHRWTWLNSLGGEWLNRVEIGHTDRLSTEWYQPLSPRQRVFASATLDARREPFDLYLDDQRITRFRRQSVTAGLHVGAPLATLGELRTGVIRGRVRMIDDTTLLPGSLLVPPASVGGIATRLRVDALDNLRFPRAGYAGDLQFFNSNPRLGATDDYASAALSVRAAISHGPHTLRVAGEAAQGVGSETLPGYELYALGGFLQLSGWRTGELLGREKRFGRVVYNYRFSRAGFLDGAHLGVSTEAGRMRLARVTGDDTPTLHGAALYVAFDTPAGPVYLGYGRSSSRKQAVYLYLGQP